MIGRVNELGRRRVRRKRCGTEARLDAEPLTCGPADLQAPERAPDLLREEARTLDGRPGKDECELFAAEAARQIELANRAGEQRCDGAQDVVAALMTVPVIELLEVVDIDEHERDQPLMGRAKVAEHRASALPGRVPLLLIEFRKSQSGHALLES